MLLVTGANGQLGRAIARHALARIDPSHLAVSVRDPSAAGELAAGGVEVRSGDFEDDDAMKRVFDGVRRLVLVSSAGMPHELRFQHHRAAIDAAQSSGVEEVIYTSLSLGAPSVIGEVHRRTEERLAAATFNGTSLRHPLYSDNFALGLLGEPEIVSAAPTGRINSAWRDDLAEAAAILLTQPERPRELYTMTGPEAYSYDDLAAAVTGLSEGPLSHRSVSTTEFAALLAVEDVPGPLVEILVALQAAIQAGAFSEVTPDLATVLGRQPRTIAEGLSRIGRAG